MRIDVLSLFPEIFEVPMNTSMMWKARNQGFLEFHNHNIRTYALDKHHQVDDTPYGGGGGMVLKADIVCRAVESVRGERPAYVVAMSPRGRVFNHALAHELSQKSDLIVLCGHYEGFDERIFELCVDEEISIGDYVLTGGELPALVLMDAVVRQIEGVLGAEGGAQRESHADGLLEGGHYTRPAEFRGLQVPPVLTSGNHGAVDVWRRQQALRQTWRKRPDLLKTAPLTEADQYYLATLALEEAQRIIEQKASS